MSTKTYMPTWEQGKANRSWVLIDAEDQILGRISTQIADTLRGKNKPDFTPHVDSGDFVVVINAEKIKLSGNKLDKKKYYHHTGYMGHLKEITARKRLETKPTELIMDAVWGMLPKNKLSRQLLTKLKVYAGNEHPHTSQIQPTTDTKKEASSPKEQ